MIKLNKQASDRVRQGDLFQDIEYLEKYSINDTEDGQIINLSIIKFPYAVVLSQDCDLQQNHTAYLNKEKSNRVTSVIMAPLFNEELFFQGKHLTKIEWHASVINKYKGASKTKLTTQANEIINNNNPRYHYLQLPDDSGIVNMIIDFKHFFTISYDNLIQNLNKCTCSIETLYREDISQRFSSYISRIGLPNEITCTTGDQE